MTDDNIVELNTGYSGDPEKPTKEKVPILQCDECSNMTWLVNPNGFIMCAVCRESHSMDDFEEYEEE